MVPFTIKPFLFSTINTINIDEKYDFNLNYDRIIQDILSRLDTIEARLKDI